jgi:uncharacterized glyoxalase superfamily protein PhnB
MKLDYRPKGYRAVTPGISASGAGRLAEFLERALGATVQECTKNADGTIGHGVLQIGDSLVEIGEARPECPARPCGIHLYSPDTDALYKRAVDAGARTLQAPKDETYGDRAAAVQDPAGNQWYLATRLEKGHIPKGFHTLTPYLIARGADAVMAFMKAAFGATEQLRFEKEDGSVMHAEMLIDDSMIEIADGAPPWKPMPCALHLYVPDADDAHARAAAAGATTLYQPKDMPYGDRECGVQDPAGNHWYIATHIEDVSEEEFMRRMAVKA